MSLQIKNILKQKKMSKEKLSLFPEMENEWEKEWHDMPEFVSDNKDPQQQIIVSFKNFEDVKKFGQIIGYPNVTPKTKSLWYPKKVNLVPSEYVYKSEEDEK